MLKFDESLQMLKSQGKMSFLTSIKLFVAEVRKVLRSCSFEESLKMKMCMKLTKQLHEKFLNAISQLGEESINLSLSIFIQVDLL
ncbi:hypothetical protein HanXRQr2_Chr14g0624781 [Helianthus annuus]|uniref:Uncharacterized protein n=1 Tax=Helianthus annuus TaxID=4232 RepID=A0A251VCZ8_HELAN|nr:hypothetical protein HanXRQr2_Chr14g0624781 [Helianthus annuus]